MGQSKTQMIKVKKDTKVKETTAQSYIQILAKISPGFIEERLLKVPQWERELSEEELSGSDLENSYSKNLRSREKGGGELNLIQYKEPVTYRAVCQKLYRYTMNHMLSLSTVSCRWPAEFLEMLKQLCSTQPWKPRKIFLSI